MRVEVVVGRSGRVEPTQIYMIAGHPRGLREYIACLSVTETGYELLSDYAREIFYK